MAPKVKMVEFLLLEINQKEKEKTNIHYFTHVDSGYIKYVSLAS